MHQVYIFYISYTPLPLLTLGYLSSSAVTYTLQLDLDDYGRDPLLPVNLLSAVSVPETCSEPWPRTSLEDHIVQCIFQ